MTKRELIKCAQRDGRKPWHACRGWPRRLVRAVSGLPDATIRSRIGLRKPASGECRLKAPPGMTEERVHRRLAAILAADVVGYSRLMEQDEAGTLGRAEGPAQGRGASLWSRSTRAASLR